MNKIKEKLYRDKYSDSYIEHYLFMYSIHRKGLLSQDFESQNRVYIDCEGKEEFQNLRTEVIKAEQQADLNWFLKVAISWEIKEIDLNNLKRMFEAIKNFKF